MACLCLDGSAAVRRCTRAGKRRRAVVLGNDQRVAVVIFKHRRVCWSHWPPLSRWLNHDGSDLRSLPLSLYHFSFLLSKHPPTPSKSSFLDSFFGSISSLKRRGPESCPHNCKGVKKTEERRVREERGEEKVLKIFLEVVKKQHGGIFLKKAQLRHIF